MDEPTPLTEVILSFLTPLMLAAGLTDTTLARRAAQEAIAAATPGAPLTATAQTIAFAMAALDSLRLAAAPDAAVTTKLRLRGNANALNRSAEQNRQALKRSLDDAAFYPPMTETGIPTLDNDHLAEDTIIADAAATQKRAAQAHTAPDSPPTTAERQNRAMWASAMAEVANDFTASLATMRPDQRRVASIQAAALTSSANALLSGAPLPVFDLPIPR
jgi:hypothetical protein